jgi:hypothetical protein
MIVGCVIAAIPHSSVVAAVQCKPQMVYGYAKDAPSAPVALRNAKVSWSGYVTRLFGASWANWDLARERDTTCTGPVQQATCTARARPCRRR